MNARIEQDDICHITEAVCAVVHELQALDEDIEHTRESVLNRLAYPEEMIKRLLGYNPAGTTQAQPKESVPAQKINTSNLPSAVDLRNKNGNNYVTSVKDQSFCSTCVAFAVSAAIEIQVRLDRNIPIDASNSDILPDLSSTQLFFCENTDLRYPCFSGRDILPLMNFATDVGVVPEACFPYPIHSPLNMLYHGCVTCDDWQEQVTQISGIQILKSTDEMKGWLAQHGAFVGGQLIHLDFLCYKTGVYHPSDASWNIQAGGHCMVCVGYDDDKQAWLCKNCWGDCWGDKGYIWLSYDQAGFDMPVYGISGLSKVYQENL